MNRHGMRALAGALLGLSLLGAAPAGAQTASVTLTTGSATLVQTTDTAWTLEKVGALNGNTVSWVIGATEQATDAGQLILVGHLSVTNTGTGPATIGNILVNLQARVNSKWVARSTDIANATDGDDATTAGIHSQASSEGFSSFTENGASGSLQFMDATNNTVFSLVPQVLIGPGETRALLFQASFDNNVLGIAAGTPIRSEAIVSFGNAVTSNASTANVDINGNGSIDSDESRIRSVPSRLTVTVPAAIPGNGTVTLSDTLSDIVATGDVSFSNVNINLGATSGTVTATVNGGTNGGTITNCAHLTGASSTVSSGGFIFPVVNGVDLEACDTVTVAGNGGGGGDPCTTPGAPGCGWEPGEMVTYDQTSWGTATSAGGSLLASNFGAIYGGTDLVVGTGRSMTFQSVTAVYDYLPAVGLAGVLTGSLVNPTTSSSGELGGEIMALKINVDASDAALLANTTPLGDLRFCNFSSVSALNGQIVRQFLATANQVLGGSSTALTPATAAAVASFINGAFTDGSPSSFAQSILVAGTCP